MWVVLISAVFIPGGPALVPEVSGPRASELDAVRAAVAVAATELGALTQSWWALGGDDPTATDSPAESTGAGTFGGFGVDRAIALRPDAVGAPPSPLPTSMLMAGWVRELAGSPSPTLTPIVVAPDDHETRCHEVGTELAERIAAASGDTALLVVGDGAVYLDARAPGGGFEPDAAALQTEIDAALASGDPAVLRALDWERCARWGAAGRSVWEVVAACAPGPATATVSYTGAPLGVGYTVATWRFG